MEDLLNEEEFLPPKDNYNPWIGFLVFYGIAIVYYVIVTTISINMRGINMLMPVNFIGGLITLLFPFIMVFRKKKNILLPPKILLSSICGLITIIFFLNIGLEIINNVYYEEFLEPRQSLDYLKIWAEDILYGFICFLIILAIRWRKLKKLSKLQSSSL